MRIVSLCPSLTELVFDLGRGAELVGITSYCVHPSDAVGAIEKVGGTKDPDVELIRSLRPDLVLMNEEENRIEDAHALEQLGIACLNSFPKDTAGTAHMVREIAKALERVEVGEGIACDIEARSARVRRDVAGVSAVRWAYLIWRKPWMTVNRDTFAHSLLSLAGGVNAFAEVEVRYPEISLDQLRDARLDILLLCTEPYPFAVKHVHELSQQLEISRNRIVIADGEYLSWHGSRTPDGIDYAEALMRSARRLNATS